MSLCTAKLIEAAINPTALNDALQVKIGLSVPDEEYFFSDQFLRYFVPLAAGGRKNRELPVSSTALTHVHIPARNNP